MKRPFERTYLSVHSFKIKKPITIVQISDLHNRLYGNGQAQLLQAIREEHPDLIACTGDLFNRHDASEYENAFTLIRAIADEIPTYVVEGNHEAALGTIGEQFLLEISQMGAIVLRNAAQPFKDVRVIGLKQRPTKAELLPLIRPDCFHLVLSHRPELFELYVSCRADLVLSGHAHGGQIRIGNLALLAPQQGLFPKYTSGLYEKNGTRMFVSKGLGDTVWVPRIHNPHELNVIRLLPQ